MPLAARLTRLSAAAAALAAATSAAVAQAPRQLYVSGSRYNATGQVIENAFGVVDPLTGAFTQLGTNNTVYQALTVTAAGELYALGVTRLYRIDPANGAVLSVISTALTAPTGLTWANGQLVARENGNGGRLVTLDPLTGAVSDPRGTLGLDDAGDVLTVRDDGAAYFVGDSVVAGTYSNTLNAVDLATGARTYVGGAAYFDLRGITDVGLAPMFGFGTCLTPLGGIQNCVAEVTVSQGAVSFQRTNRAPGFFVTAAAAVPVNGGTTPPPPAVVPEPSTVALLGAGVTALGAWARRRRQRA